MQNAGLDEAQAEIKTALRNNNNLRYADDTTLTAESEEELKSLLMKEQSKKVGLKLNIQKTKIMRSGPISSRQIDGETMKTVRLYFGVLQMQMVHLQMVHLQMLTAAMKLKDTCSLEENLWQTQTAY